MKIFNSFRVLNPLLIWALQNKIKVRIKSRYCYSTHYLLQTTVYQTRWFESLVSHWVILYVEKLKEQAIGVTGTITPEKLHELIVSVIFSVWGMICLACSPIVGFTFEEGAAVKTFSKCI